MASITQKQKCVAVKQWLGERSLVFVGMMGAGKTTIGRRIAQLLELPFHDADHEIERAANMSVEEIFSVYGEDEFRRGEHDVILRLLENESPQILATGGGAFMNDNIRQAILDDSVSLWLKADFDVLMERVRKRTNRPLLQQPNPEAIMRRLMDQRYPIYEQADLTFISRDVSHDYLIRQIITMLYKQSLEENSVQKNSSANASAKTASSSH